MPDGLVASAAIAFRIASALMLQGSFQRRVLLVGQGWPHVAREARPEFIQYEFGGPGVKAGRTNNPARVSAKTSDSSRHPHACGHQPPAPRRDGGFRAPALLLGADGGLEQPLRVIIDKRPRWQAIGMPSPAAARPCRSGMVGPGWGSGPVPSQVIGEGSRPVQETFRLGRSPVSGWGSTGASW